ncbi:MAG TPA: glycosyltransferase family 39 protein [Blastocatellia bacterium]
MRAQLALKLCLAVGVGFGVLSWVYFLQLSLFGPSRRAFIATQITLLAALFVTFFLRMRSPRRSIPTEAVEEQPRFKLRRILSVVFIVALVSSTVALIFISLKQPHGEWDAWAVYNMKARFLFRAGDHWKDLFSEQMNWAGQDYPLLLPAAVAALWTSIGREVVAVPALVAVLFTLASIGVVTSAAYALRTSSQGLLAGLIVVCTPFFINHGANQYSDIPIGFFFLATFVFLHFHDRFKQSGNGFLVLAGLTTGFSAWTKNEGLLFILAVLASRLVVAMKKKELNEYARQIRFYLTGLAPILLIVIYLKITLAARNGLLFSTEGPTLAQKLLNLSRYFTIADTVMTHGLAFGGGVVSIAPLLLFYLLLVGTGVKQEDRPSVVASSLAMAIMLVGYSAVYVFTPRDVYWHLMTSIDRLFSQLWPTLVFVFFLAVRTPEEALAKKGIASAPA